MNLTRRSFIQTSASLATTTALAPRLFAESNVEDLPIIDTHQHLWDLSKFKPPWLGEAPEVLARSYVTRDYLEATQDVQLAKAVYMEVDVHPDQQQQEAEHVIALSKSKDHPTAAAVISGRPNSSGFRDYITQYKNSRYIKGVRQVLHVDSAARGLCLEAPFVQSMHLLGEFGKSFDLCMRPSELDDGWKLAKECPHTRFILDHCGNADPMAWLPTSKEMPWHEVDAWKQSIDQLADCPNVICKISGIVARAPSGWTSDDIAPIVNFCLDQFGPDRVIFGGDWPVCLLGSSYAGWVKALHEIIRERSIQDCRKLLHDNAVRLYGLA